MAPIQIISFIDILAIILSIVALIVTVIGFFAALKFYRDGVRLQVLANDALVKIEEKVWSIQSQVGGMFERTLDAAIGRADKLDGDYNALNEQLETAAKTISESALEKIDSAGEGEIKRFTKLVEDQIDLLRERLNEARETVEEYTELASVKAWNGFLEFISNKNRAMSNVLKDWNSAEIKGNKINLKLTSDQNRFSAEYFDAVDRLNKLTSYAKEYFGERMFIVLHK